MYGYKIMQLMPSEQLGWRNFRSLWRSVEVLHLCPRNAVGVQVDVLGDVAAQQPLSTLDFHFFTGVRTWTRSSVVYNKSQ